MNTIHHPNNNCPIHQLFEFLGKKWIIWLIKTLQDHWEQSFSQLQSAMSSINSRILTERLDEGIAQWFIIRTVSTQKPLKIRYNLTHKWHKLWTKICELADFAKNL